MYVHYKGNTDRNITVDKRYHSVFLVLCFGILVWLNIILCEISEPAADVLLAYTV